VKADVTVDKRDKLRELVVYVFFGVLTTLVNMGANYCLEYFLQPRWGDNSFLFSKIAAFLLALAFAFIVNKLFVFKQKSWERRLVVHELLTFSAARLVSFILLEYVAVIITFKLIWPKVEPWFAPWWAGLKLPFEIVPREAYRYITHYGMISVVVVILNYIFSKWVVFRKKKEEPAP